MNKKIITLLIITISTLSHSMEKIFHDTNAPEILLCITKHLCLTNVTYGPEVYRYGHFVDILHMLGKNINHLSGTNRFLNTYYSNEKTAQTITRCIACHRLDNEFCISNILGRYKNIFKSVFNKIDKLTFTTYNHGQLSKEDLNDSWYVNLTQSTESTTLLYMAHYRKRLQDIKLLLNAKANVKKNSNNGLLSVIAQERCQPKYEDHKEVNLAIAQLLLEYGADPDFRLNTDPTPLMITVCNNDKKYAHLLIWHNANPYKTGIWIDNSLKNSFEIEKASSEKNAFEIEPTGWLQRMVDERKNILFNYLLFKYYSTQKECTLLPELVQLIIYNLWHIGTTYNEK